MPHFLWNPITAICFKRQILVDLEAWVRTSDGLVLGIWVPHSAMLRSYLTPGPHSIPQMTPFFCPYQWCMVLLMFQRTAGFQYFTPRKTASKNRRLWLLKNQNRRTSQSGYLKTAESKNRQLWVFQNPKRTASFHERPTGYDSGLANTTGILWCIHTWC